MCRDKIPSFETIAKKVNQFPEYKPTEESFTWVKFVFSAVVAVVLLAIFFGDLVKSGIQPVVLQQTLNKDRPNVEDVFPGDPTGSLAKLQEIFMGNEKTPYHCSCSNKTIPISSFVEIISKTPGAGLCNPYAGCNFPFRIQSNGPLINSCINPPYNPPGLPPAANGDIKLWCATAKDSNLMPTAARRCSCPTIWDVDDYCPMPPYSNDLSVGNYQFFYRFSCALSLELITSYLITGSLFSPTLLDNETIKAHFTQSFEDYVRAVVSSFHTNNAFQFQGVINLYTSVLARTSNLDVDAARQADFKTTNEQRYPEIAAALTTAPGFVINNTLALLYGKAYNISYEKYFNQCNPKACVRTVQRTNFENFAHAVSFTGGLIAPILKVSSLLLACIGCCCPCAGEQSKDKKEERF